MFIYDDDFLTEKEISEIEEHFWSKRNSWHLHEKTQEGYVSHPGVVDTNIQDIPYFTKSLQDNDIFHSISIDIINKFCNKHNIAYKEASRIKLNIQPSVKDQYTLYPHIDTTEPHLVFLYYVSDSDGDTVLYNETFTGQKIEVPLTIMKSVTPKRGAAFVIDGRHFHSITPPKETMLRGVINANLVL